MARKRQKHSVKKPGEAGAVELKDDELGSAQGGGGKYGEITLKKGYIASTTDSFSFGVERETKK